MVDRADPAPVPQVQTIALSDLRAALALGWRDFRRAPLFGLVFAAFYVVTGFALLALDAGTFVWTLALALGFPLVAPFAAVGLYEVSRRLETGEPLSWREVLGVVWAERSRQLPWMGMLLLMIFLFWSFFAHMLFALFMGFSALTNISTSWEALMTPEGLAMMALEFLAGAGVAALTFSLTVVAMPLLVDRELDFVTAMLVSVRAVLTNPLSMAVWALTVALVLFAGMVPLFLGLFVALPILGHATWHLYRRTLSG